MSDIAERVKKIVVEHLGVEADKVAENANFIDDLGPTASTLSSS
jgi:acyl carrier protein